MARPAKKQKSIAFVWEGLDKHGAKTEGELSAINPALAKAELRRRGITPTKVKKKPIALFNSGKSISSSDIAVFTRQWATMLNSGIPVIQSLQIILEGLVNHPKMQQLISSVKADIEAGVPTASALKKHPRHFDELFCSLVNSGEQAGALDTMLSRIATYKEKTESLKGKIKKAMFYPIAVMAVAFIVCAILLIFVVPQFQGIFQSVGADLPAFTLMVIKVSDAFIAYWWFLLPGIGGIPFAILAAKRKSKKFSNFLDRVILKLPIFGDIIYKAIIARFARTLSTTFSAGVPLVDALDSVAGATGNNVFYEAVHYIKDQVSGGQKVYVAMKATKKFPIMAAQMVSIGEESGTLDSMLEKVANIYEEEVDNAVDGLSSLIEPLIIAILGVLVGGLVVAMYLPIFQMGSVI